MSAAVCVNGEVSEFCCCFGREARVCNVTMAVHYTLWMDEQEK